MFQVSKSKMQNIWRVKQFKKLNYLIVISVFKKWRKNLIFKMIQNKSMKCRNTNASRTRKKQPPELFYKSRFSQNFRNIYRKSPVLESLLNKVAGLEVCNFINTSVFLWIPLNFKNTYFEDHLCTAASD